MIVFWLKLQRNGLKLKLGALCGVALPTAVPLPAERGS